MITIDVAELRTLGTRTADTSAALGARLAAALREAQQPVEEAATSAIRAVTPQGAPREDGRETLAQSTKPITTLTGLVMQTAIIQDATSAPNQDGSGGGFHYMRAVRDGRKAITAPSDGPFSTGKRALAGPGFGPVKSVKAHPADPYPERATPALREALSTAARLAAMRVAVGTL